MTNSASPDSDTRTSVAQQLLYMFVSAVKDIPDVKGGIFDFAAPKVYKVNNKLAGIYAVGANVASVVPTEPYIVLNQIQGLKNGMIKVGKTIKYEDFIQNISAKEYYDFNHVIVTLSAQEADGLINQYGTEI